MPKNAHETTGTTPEDLLRRIAKRFVGVQQDNLTRLERNIAKELCLFDYLSVDGNGEFEQR